MIFFHKLSDCILLSKYLSDHPSSQTFFSQLDRERIFGVSHAFFWFCCLLLNYVFHAVVYCFNCFSLLCLGCSLFCLWFGLGLCIVVSIVLTCFFMHLSIVWLVFLCIFLLFGLAFHCFVCGLACSFIV